VSAAPRSKLRRLGAVASLSLRPVYVAGLLYSSIVRHFFLRCGQGLRLPLTTSIRGYRNIVIGNNFVALGHLYLFAHDGGFVQIGDNCSVNTNVQIGGALGRIVIGNNVIIAPNVVVRAADHGISRAAPIRYQPHRRGEIIIEDDVWLGSNAVVTSGVTIARGTVVGAGAVVTRSTEPYSIVAGVPARKIGERA
jgi:galactoside O-acetyltransferase